MFPELQYQLTLNDSPKARMQRLPKNVSLVVKAAVRYWHTNMLPEHFKPGAAEKYGYAGRGMRYCEKKKIRGKYADLVYSGKARDRLTRSIALKVIGKGSTAAKGHFVVSGEIDYFYRRAANAPDMPAEMKAVNDSDYKKIGRFIRDGVLENMKRGRTRKQIVR